MTEKRPILALNEECTEICINIYYIIETKDCSGTLVIETSLPHHYYYISRLMIVLTVGMSE